MTKELFEEISKWQNETFGQATSLSKLAHLEQETFELEHDIQNNNPDRRLEFADCFILLFGCAASDGMSYENIIACINEKMAINRTRKWGNPDSNGVVNHIEEDFDEFS